MALLRALALLACARACACVATSSAAAADVRVPSPPPLSAAAAADEVHSLPGYLGALPSRHFAGYVPVSETKRLFYYLASAERGAPLDAPLLLWLNGGPGCSSFDGFVYEHGPFRFGRGPLGRPSLSRNAYAWSSLAHVLYLDSPAGVGLSYGDAAAGDYSTNDTQTAADADAFLRAFLARHGWLADKRLFIAGESYAGIYVPVLARTVLQNNARAAGDTSSAAAALPQLNLVGYAVGNGCTDEMFDGNALPSFAFGKSLISVDQYAALRAACPHDQYWNASAGGACAEALDALDATLAGLNLYDILEPCVGAEAPLPRLTFGRAWPLRATLPAAPARVRTWASLQLSVPCMDSSLAAEWLNRPDVRAAIHAQPVDVTGAFSMCTDRIQFTHDAGSMIPIHKALLAAGLRALVYSGDADMCVPHTGSEAWTRSLRLPVADEWRAWRGDDGQVAGYMRRYKGGGGAPGASSSSLTYATVKGAGHTVPQYKPAQSRALLARFLSDAPL